MYIQSIYSILFHSAVMNSGYFAMVTVGVIATILTIGFASTIYGQTNMTAGNMTAGNMTAGDTTSSGGGEGGDDGDEDNGSDDGEDDGEGGGSN
ncbi:MAG: hypothetical protein ACRD5E_09485 [Nitrososphaeraceae archaeon]